MGKKPVPRFFFLFFLITVYVWSLCPFFPSSSSYSFDEEMRSGETHRGHLPLPEKSKEIMSHSSQLHMCALGHRMRKGHEVRGKSTQGKKKRSGGAAF